MSRGSTVREATPSSFLVPSPVPFTEEHGGDGDRKYRENRASSPGDGRLYPSTPVAGESIDHWGSFGPGNRKSSNRLKSSLKFGSSSGGEVAPLWVSSGRPCGSSSTAVPVKEASGDRREGLVWTAGALRSKGRRKGVNERSPRFGGRGCPWSSASCLFRFWLAVPGVQMMNGGGSRSSRGHFFTRVFVRRPCTSLRWYQNEVSSSSCRLHSG